jgi:hypothetical protein
MRVFLLAALLLAPLGQAAWIDDPAGDLGLQADGAPAAVPGVPTHQSIDITGLDVVEGPDAFTFTLHVADLSGMDDTSADGVLCDVFFLQGERAFRIHLWRPTPALGGGFANLYTRDGDGAWEQQPLADVAATLDAAADTIAFGVARADMADRSGAAPFPGRALEDVHAECRNYGSAVSLVGGTPPVPARISDRVPDLGLVAGVWPVTLGARQTGHAVLTSPEPFRASNGEATTFAYNVTAHNTGSTDDAFVLRAVDVPAFTNVSLASDKLQIPGNGQQSFQVWVTVPFAHDHGASRSFILEMASATDTTSVGRIELGVRYLAVAQPAGHHDTLYVHSFQEQGLQDPVVEAVPGVVGNGGYLNTLDEDPADSHQGLSFMTGNTFGPSEHWEWEVMLAPSLLIGLDADLARVGEVEISFGSRTPMTDVQVSAEILVGAPGMDLVTLVTLAPTAATATDDVYTVKGDLVPDAAADLIPYTPGMNLYLHVTLDATGPTDAVPIDAPWLLPMSSLRLPLLAYHDPVEGLPETGAVVLAGEPNMVAEAPAKDTPSAAWLALVALGLGLVVARRRQS